MSSGVPFYIVLVIFFSFLRVSQGGSDSNYTDAKCKAQNENFLKNVNAKEFIKEFRFVNETKKSVLLSWSHGDTKTVILVATHGTDVLSDIYYSDNYGASFRIISKQFDDGKIYVSRTIGLQRNQYDSKHVVLVCEVKGSYSSSLWISEDEGRNWQKKVIGWMFIQPFQFHPKQKRWMLGLDRQGYLRKSKDGGKNWAIVDRNVEKFMWSTHKNDPVGTIYYMKKHLTGFLATFLNIGSRDLLKSEDGKSSQTLRKDIWQFSAHGKFLYLSERRPDDQRKRFMKVSTDGGKNFDEVQLMSITPDRFYSIMDMSEDLIFMHVDNPGNTGHGTLYTSGSKGILYSKSLERHLYPNFLSISDFYPAQSMRGTYITTQMNSDNSMHSVISFNRGAEWKLIRKPSNDNCKPGVSPCNLQVSSLYSKVNKVMSNVPLSSKSAPGIILVHGHVHSTLQTTEADVYVTSDGGYNWNLALRGTHTYQIADHGGLLIAVPKSDPTVVKFSTDEGRCWHSYRYTNDKDIIVTGVVTEPNNKIMNVVIWGYGQTDHIWRVYSIDFKKAIPRSCTDSDYESWTPHAEMTHSSGKDEWNGCLLGVKEEFKRLKKDSWCSNGEEYEVTKSEKPCPCTQDDYECEYGYSRPVNSYKCERNTLIKELDSCREGDLKKILTHGYRSLPGDRCEGGFTPDPTKQVSLNKKCGVDEKGIEVEKGIHVDKQKPVQHAAVKDVSPNKFDKSKIVWIVAGVSLLLIAAVIIAVMFSRYRQLRERHVNYKYSLLNTQNDEAFDTAIDVGLIDNQHPQTATNKRESNTNVSANGGRVDGKNNPVLRSYHDDSDVDMIE